MITTLQAALDQKLVDFDSKLDATLHFGESMGGDKEKKGSKAGDAAAVGAVGAGAGATGLYLRGHKVSGGNAKGADAMRIGARDIGNKAAGAVSAVRGGVKAGGVKAGGLLKKAGSAVAKAAKRFDTLERVNELCAKADSIINFEVMDDATARKPVQKQKAPNHTALVGVGMGTVGAAAGYAGGKNHKKIMKAGTKHAAQIAKASHKGISIAKDGYKTGTSKVAAIGKGIMGSLRRVK